MKYQVVVSDRRHPDYSIEQRILAEHDAELTILDCRTEADMIAQCADVDGILLDMAPVSANVVKAMKR